MATILIKQTIEFNPQTGRLKKKRDTFLNDECKCVISNIDILFLDFFAMYKEYQNGGGNSTFYEFVNQSAAKLCAQHFHLSNGGKFEMEKEVLTIK